MGGRGSRSTSTTQTTPRATMTPPQPQPQPPQQQAAPPPPPPPPAPVQQDNSRTTRDIAAMTDDQLAAIMRAARTADLPNHLNDANDVTQRFVYTANLNAKPTVLSDSEFQKFLRDNNIPRSRVLARSTNGANYTVNGTTMKLSAKQTTDLIKYGKLTYVGGKHGGQAAGAGTYFDMNGGVNTGYGQRTMVAVLNPKTARSITDGALKTRAQAFMASNPKFAAQVGAYSTRTKSIYALAMGYNVVKLASYTNVIDRSALIIQENDI